MRSPEEVAEEVFKRAKVVAEERQITHPKAVCSLLMRASAELIASTTDAKTNATIRNLYNEAYNGFWRGACDSQDKDKFQAKFTKQIVALDDSFWLVRESLRHLEFMQKFQEAPWFLEVTRYLKEQKLLGAPHFMRVSEKNPKLWVYTESPEKAVLDRQVQAKLGKVLKTLVPTEKEETVQSLATYFQNAGAAPVKFARTEEEIADVYKRGPMTCMSASPSVKAYASPDLAVAYVEGFNGKIPARSVVSMKDKQYTRIHGTIACLEPALQQLGFVEGILQGNRMNPVKTESGALLVPNMDYGASGCVVNGVKVPNIYGYVRFKYDAEEKTLVIDHTGNVHGECGYFTPPVEKAKVEATA